jgi:predicted aspartyl protease
MKLGFLALYASLASVAVARGTPFECPSHDMGPPLQLMPRSGSGWIPVREDLDGDILVPVRVNGIAATALMDTGAPETVLGQGFADRILKRTAGAHYEQDQRGRRLAASISIKLRAVKFRSSDTYELDAPIESGEAKPQFDLILGHDLLQWLRWEVDFDRHRTRFSCGGQSPLRHDLPVYDLDGMPRFFTVLTLNGTDVKDLLIDTGGGLDLLIPPSLAERLDLTPVSDVKLYWMGRHMAQLMRMQSLRLGPYYRGERIVDVSAEVAPVWDPTGSVGIGVLGEFNFVFDPVAGWMQLSPRHSVSPLRKHPTTGLQLTYYGGQYKIIHVMLNSPAAAAGIAAGDKICGIAGLKLSGSQAQRQWLEFPSKGSRLSLTMCNGKNFRFIARPFY